MRRNSNGGTAHLLACGCRTCRDRMQREFARILDTSYSMDELCDVIELEADARRELGDGSLNASLRERIAAYSGPLPDTSA